jgi:integrase
MPLNVVRRKDTGALTITGFVKYPDGSKLRVRSRAQSDRRDLAKEEAVALEARLLREAWHGEKRGARPFAEAVESYLLSAPRARGDLARLRRILVALGDVSLAAVDQAAVNRVRATILSPDAAPATITRGVIMPIRAVMRHAAEQGWCDVPRFKVPKRTPGRTNFLVPDEARKLVLAAAPHIKPLLIFLLGTGARMAEALELEWRDVDLTGARAIFWRTKTGARRVAALLPAAIAVLAALPHRDGRVFQWRRGEYKDRERQGGGQIKTAWRCDPTRRAER